MKVCTGRLWPDRNPCRLNSTFQFTSLRSGAVDAATIYVRLVPKKQRKLTQDALGGIIRREIASVAAAVTYTYAAGSMAGNQKQLQLQVQGPDASVLTRVSEQIADSMRGVAGVVDVGLSTKGQTPELSVRVNRGLASSLGVSVGQLAQSLRFAFAGVDAGTWVDPAGRLDESKPIRELFYKGEPYEGRSTGVFAYYASPATLGIDKTPGKKFPAVVLIHGGGGNAFEQWVNVYAKRGYAAISMDLALARSHPNKASGCHCCKPFR